MSRSLPLYLLCFVTAMLTGCRLDVLVDVNMATNGSGVVTVTAVADQELVESQADLISDLDFDDAIDNGWEIGEPEVGADDSVMIVLTHQFENANELANVLSSIGPPLTVPGAARTSDGKQVTNGVSGVLILENGYATFADADLIKAAQGVPFEDDVAASQVPIEQGFSFTLDIHLPGRLIKAPSGTAIDDETIRWVAPTNGDRLPFEVTTAQTIGSSGSWWARPLSWISLGVLAVWLVFSIGFIAFVTRRRRQQTRTRQLALRNLSDTRNPSTGRKHRS